MTLATTTRTWCDGWGAWHCEVTQTAPGNRREAHATAISVVTAEIHASNSHDILTGLRFVGDTAAGAFVTTHWREEDGT